MKVADLMPASSPGDASSSSTWKPRRSAQRMSMRSSISAQSCESVPPVPAWTETAASPASYGPAKRRSSSSPASLASISLRCSATSSAIDSSSAASSSSASRSSSSRSVSRYAASLRDARACSADTFAARSWSSQKPGSPISRSSASRRSASAAGSKVVREQLQLVAEIRSHRLGPVALLKFLAGAAPARVVAADLVALVHVPGLHDRQRLDRRAVLVVGDLRPGGARRRRCERARLALGAAARVLEVASAVAAAAPLRPEGAVARALDLHLHVEDVARELLPDRLDEGREHVEALVLVGDERVLLGEPAEVDALAQVVHVVQVLAPALVDDLEQDEALDLAHQLVAQLLLPLVVGLERVVLELRLEHLALDRVGVHVLRRDRDRVDLLELGQEAVEVPVLDVVADEVLVHHPRDHVADLRARRLGHVLALEDAVADLVDDLALLVHHVVVLEDALADQEVLLLDLALGALDLLREHLRVERLLLARLLRDRSEAVEDPVDAVAREEAHEVVLGGGVEARLAGGALPARAAAQLVVDPARLVPLGAEDEQAAGLEHALAVGLDPPLDPGVVVVPLTIVLGRARLEAELEERLMGLVLGVAAELDVDAAAGHVGRDRHGARAAGLGDDVALALGVLRLGVQHGVLDAALVEPAREQLRDLDRDRADQDRLALLVAPLDLARDGAPLAFLGLVDEVVLVLADHRPVGGHLDHLELVDLHELGGLGERRAGHARELVVLAEV